MAASAHEYEQYTPSTNFCGPACTPFNNTATMLNYTDVALDVIATTGLALNETSCFRGLALWKWDVESTLKKGGDYPPGSGNRWSPLAPHPDVVAALARRLPRARRTPPSPPSPPSPSPGPPPPGKQCDWAHASVACPGGDKDCKAWIGAHCAAPEGVTGYCRANHFCHLTVVPVAATAASATNVE